MLVDMSTIYTFQKLAEAEFKKQARTLGTPLPIEQTPFWGRFDDKQAERQFLGSFSYFEGNRLIAVASATFYHQKGRNWIWSKHGPIFASVPNSEVIKKMCATLKSQFSSVN